jgi:hypothetical protein
MTVTVVRCRRQAARACGAFTHVAQQCAGAADGPLSCRAWWLQQPGCWRCWEPTSASATAAPGPLCCDSSWQHTPGGERSAASVVRTRAVIAARGSCVERCACGAAGQRSSALAGGHGAPRACGCEARSSCVAGRQLVCCSYHLQCHGAWAHRHAACNNTLASSSRGVRKGGAVS